MRRNIVIMILEVRMEYCSMYVCMYGMYGHLISLYKCLRIL